MAGHGEQILAADFVTIQDKAQALLGTGAGNKGYGQTVQSADVFTGNNITKAQWDALRYDIINIKYHQTGLVPDIVSVNRGELIGYGASSPNTNYDTIVNSATDNRFDLAPSQSITTSVGTATSSATWSANASVTITISFTTADEGRYFFNSGGKIRITPSLSGGSSTGQVTAWRNFLNHIGTLEFGANTDPTVNYYTLTDQYKTVTQGNMSTYYLSNNIKLEAKTNVANNSSGTATVLYIQVTLTDAWVDLFPASPPPDAVDGTLSIAVEELKAAGTMVPSGTFSIASPLYSISSITVH